MAQAYSNFELLIIDDGSTDGSQDICDEIAHCDQRIKVYHTPNGGVSHARNLGLKYAEGQFIFWIDADDFLEPNALDSLLQIYSDTAAELVIGNAWYVSNTEKSEGINIQEDKILSRMDIVNYTRNYLSRPRPEALYTIWGKLYSASIIKENQLFFDNDLRCWEDVVFNFEYLMHIKKIAYTNTPLYNYVLRGDSLSWNIEESNIFGHFNALQAIAAFFHEVIPVQDVNKCVGHACVNFSIIKMVHLCRMLKLNNFVQIYRMINRLISNSMLRQSLSLYSPACGNSRLLPIFIKFKLTSLIIMLCYIKAKKRFKKK